MDFVAHFTRFPTVQKFWKSVKIWQSYREFKGGNFFDTQCSYGAQCHLCTPSNINVFGERLFSSADNTYPCKRTGKHETFGVT